MKIQLCAWTIMLFFLTSCSRTETDLQNQVRTNPFIGSWKIDSIRAGGHSDPMALLIVYLLQQDPTDTDLLVTADSLFFSNGSSDRMAYQLDRHKKIILKDRSGTTYPIRMINDSAIVWTLGKETEVFLKRK